MRTVKVQCECGQRYAFDVAATDVQMTYSVACPICGVDGTPAANQILAQTPEQQPPPPPPPATVAAVVSQRTAPMRVQFAGTPAVAEPAAPPPARLLPGQIARPQAEQEARAKIFWGDPPEEVVKFLMRQSIPYADASEIVNGFFDERAATLRSDGIGKIISGVGMACVPLVGWAVFAKIGVLPIKLFALMIMVGLWGAYRILKGTLMVVSPRSETGDVASQ